MKKKLVVIGLDGATFDAIIPFIKKGKLPILKKLMKNGVYGKLQSCIPPVSCPAWPSFATGKNSAKHLVLDWHYYNKDYKEIFNSSSNIVGKKFWDYLNEEGVECGIVNMPITFPPMPLQGFMVSGFLAADEESNFAYPPELKEELLKKNYKIDPVNRYALSDEGFLEKMRNLMEMRKETFIWMIENKKWDMLMAVFRPEPIQHRFWKKDTMDIIEDTYERLDLYVGEMLKESKKKFGEFDVIIMSDHGFGRIPDYNFYFNRWLANKGLFYLKEDKKKIPLDKIYRFLIKIGMGWTKYFVGHKLDKIRFIDYSEDVDWNKSKCFIRVSENTGMVFLNKVGRFNQGILEGKEIEKTKEEIKTELSKLEFKGEKIATQFWDKEDLYNGVDIAPDIIFKIHDNFRGLEIFDRNEIVKIPEKDKRGWHGEKGIFIASGPSFKEKKEILGANLIDVTPTILKVYGIEKPEEMDGEVLDVFKEK